MRNELHIINICITTSNTQNDMLYKCKDICWVNENLCATYENGYVFFLCILYLKVCDFTCNFAFVSCNKILF